MPIPLDAWLTAVNAELAALAPKHEGLRDYARLNLQPEAAQAIADAVRSYDRAVGRLSTLKQVLDGLITDGYPSLPVRTISTEAKADLDANAASIAVANAEFVTAAPATTLNMRAGATEPK